MSSGRPAPVVPGADPILSARDVTKVFGAVRALDGVSIDLIGGQVTALLGDNGAGKSTLVKCLSGLYSATSGTIHVDGTAVTIDTPDDARRLGIETVYQNLAVIDTLDVVDNLFLNRELVVGRSWLSRRVGLLDRRRMRRDSAAALGRLDIRIPSLSADVGQLSGGQRQAVAIGRAVSWGQRVVMLDEPTAALGVEQQARVLDLIRTMRGAGVAVLLITHNMQNVLEVCDRAIVLRQGRTVADSSVAGLDGDDLVAFITGSRTR